MYTLTLSPQEVRTVRDALERFQSDEFESLETFVNYDRAEASPKMAICERGANIIAASDVLARLPRVSEAKVDLTFEE